MLFRSLRVHLGRLEELEYLLTRREAGRVVYELAWDGEGQAGEPFVMGLIDVSDLEQPGNEWRYDDQAAGAEGRSAGRLRPECGPLAGLSRGAEHREIPSPASGLLDPIPPTPPDARPGLNGAAVVIVPVAASA